MGAFFVVDRSPRVGDLTDLIQIFKEVSIEHFMPIGPVKSLDKGILAWLAGLDVKQFDTFVLVPLHQCSTS